MCYAGTAGRPLGTLFSPLCHVCKVNSFNITSLGVLRMTRWLSWCPDSGLGVISSQIFSHFPMVQQVMAGPALLLCAVPSVQCSEREKYLAKILLEIAGRHYQILSLNIFSFLCSLSMHRGSIPLGARQSKTQASCHQRHIEKERLAADFDNFSHKIFTFKISGSD